MKIRHILLVILLFSLVSCFQKPQHKFNDSKVVYAAWAEFHQNKDAASCQKFLTALENYKPENFNSYPELKNATKNQIENCLTTGASLLQQLENGEVVEQNLIESQIEQIDLSMLAYLRNQNFVLEDTHKKFYDYYLIAFIAIIAGAVILIYLNAREIKKRDKIIYNSEQFLKHSMEVQEAERRRISMELHDTVAQSMRYVSLLAESLAEKETASKIIKTQNENIDSIRKLCYNLTPPNFSAENVAGALELMGQKIFDTDKNDKNGFQLRIVVEDAVDFSVYTDEQLMNIYRIVQEAFQNIKKHACASEVTVLFKKDLQAQGALKIIITDDGKGMSTEIVDQINTGLIKYNKFTDALTRREKDVMELLLRRCTNDQIANELGIKKRAVENYISVIYEKTGVNDRAELITKYGL
ncbi:MAG: hypothetical protein J5798_11995 [Spirochaetaceae bacterium]|nr:hypothetical protein [Spirochaetaceae bacterium]